MRRVLPLFTLLLLLLHPAPAMAGDLPFFNGLDGHYWNLTKNEVMALAPGKFLGEKRYAGMPMLEYDTPAGDMAAVTSYLFRNGKCWKVTVALASKNKEEVPTMRAMFKTVLDEVTAKLGGAHQNQNWEDMLYRIYWRSERTNARLEFSAVGAANEESSLALHLEAVTPQK